MATERFSFLGDAGVGHYLAIFNAAGQIYDWNDNTFKALSAPPTTPAEAATEQADLGGTGKSGFIVDVDLGDLNGTDTGAVFRTDWYTDANATALVSNTLQFGVKSSALWDPATQANFSILDGHYTTLESAYELLEESVGMIAENVADILAGGYICQLGINVKSTEGKVLQLRAWLDFNGQFIDLHTVDPDATVSITISEHESGVVQVTAGSGEIPNDAGVFEFEYDMEVEDAGYPNLVDDRGYTAFVSIAVNGTTYTSLHEFASIGGE